MRKSIKLVLLLLIFTILNNGYSQVWEDFSDGDFTNNPTWTGDVQFFKISTYSGTNYSQQPRLQSDGEGSAIYLALPNELNSLDSTEWRFWIRFSISSGVTATNNARFYLSSNNEDLKAPLNGYFVMFGDETSSANKNISLCRQAGTSYEKLFVGNNTTINSSSSLGVRVTRNNDGLWKLYVDPNGGVDYELEGTAVDNIFTTGEYSGIYFMHTSANKNNLYLDDIYIGHIEKDITPPTVEFVEVIDESKLLISFSELVVQSEALEKTNYTLDHSVGNPVSVIVNDLDAKKYILEFDHNFIPNQIYNINIKNISDLAENQMEEQTIAFALYNPSPWDIVISEIMADPDPVVALPEAEYIELFNRTSIPINISGWLLQYGTTTRILPNYTLAPFGYAIICAASNAEIMSQYGDVIPISSMQITNSGQTISLSTSEDMLIHSITFSDKWYGNDAKKDGGWSLEMIDPNNPCAEATNWTASVDSRGGTPCEKNSVDGVNPDVFSPKLKQAIVIDENKLLVHFSEKMNPQSIESFEDYSVDFGIGNPVNFEHHPPLFKMLTLEFNNDFQENTIYTLTVNGNLSDCAGNVLASNSTVQFGVPSRVEEGDIIINEILSNPPTNGVEYVELYNKSDKYINLASVKLGSVGRTSNTLYTVAPDGYVMSPKSYALLSSNSQKVKENYIVESDENLVEMLSFPQYNNNDGTVLLQDMEGNYLDEFTYNKDMHYPLLKDTKGVSLERISFDLPTQDENNWHSASSNAGYGTPGYKNSQYSDFVISEDIFTIEPAIFTPDNDGVDDVLFIAYNLEETGYRANISIFSSNGHRIKQIANNELLGYEGVYQWNGTNEANLKAEAGIYIVFIELWNLDGKVKRYKKACTLGVRFK